MTKEMPLTDYPPTDAATFNLEQIREEEGQKAYEEALALHNEHLSAFNKMSKATPSSTRNPETNSKWVNVGMDKLHKILSAKRDELARLERATQLSTPEEIDDLFKGIRDETYQHNPLIERYSKMTVQQTDALKKHLRDEISSLESEMDPFSQDTLN